MITEIEYNRAVRYANKTLRRPEYSVLLSTYEGQDAVQDGLIRLTEKKKELRLDNLIVETRNAIGRATYYYIKSHPELAEELRKRNKEVKSRGRKNLAKWYLMQILRQKKLDITEKNIAELKNVLLKKRNGAKKYDLIQIVIPKIPKDGIYLPTIAKGYENCIGYYITKQGELFSCKGDRVGMATVWSKKKVKKNGAGSLNINNKTKTIYPKLLISKLCLKTKYTHPIINNIQ
ncbi:hypothetical protein LCGC14_0536820 [marine sediment metagenome]|uniref:Uncharacterized protein n=1 Tax=marine sediment metagenome TaxID=412755 RepID=A0A0F9SCC3_9ZZZZ